MTTKHTKRKKKLQVIHDPSLDLFKRIVEKASPALREQMRALTYVEPLAMKSIGASLEVNEDEIRKALEDLELDRLPRGIPSRWNPTGPMVTPTQERWYEIQRLLIKQIKERLKLSKPKKWTGSKGEFSDIVREEYSKNRISYKNLKTCCRIIFARHIFPQYPEWKWTQCYQYMKQR